MLWTLLPLACAVLAGCGSRIAPVSGRITLNGKALAKASVTFAPVASQGELEPGPSSASITDADGRYTLKLIGRNGSGAMIGKHKVMIALQEAVNTADDNPVKLQQLPLKYNGKTTLEFDVPASGTSKADFNLTVP